MDHSDTTCGLVKGHSWYVESQQMNVFSNRVHRQVREWDKLD